MRGSEPKALALTCYIFSLDYIELACLGTAQKALLLVSFQVQGHATSMQCDILFLLQLHAVVALEHLHLLPFPQAFTQTLPFETTA